MHWGRVPEDSEILFKLVFINIATSCSFFGYIVVFCARIDVPFFAPSANLGQIRNQINTDVFSRETWEYNPFFVMYTLKDLV